MDDFDETMKDIKDNLIARIQRQEKEIERLNNIIKSGINEELRKELDEILKCNQRQANRIDKAIEYIEENAKPFIDDYGYVLTNDKMIYSDEILEILQGSDKEW